MHNRVTSDDLSDRIDAEYYSKEFMNNEAKFSAFRNGQLQTLVDSTKKNNISDLSSNGSFAFLREIKYSTKNGIPFIRTQNIQENYIDSSDLIFIDKDSFNKVQKSVCGEGNLIVCRKGKVGTSAIIPGTLNDSNCSENVTRFILDQNKVNPHYCSLFLNSYHGNLRFIREATGVIQKWINNEKLRTIKIILPDHLVQNYIGDKVRLAEKLRERSKELGIVIKDKMQECFAGNPKPHPSKHNTVIPDLLTANRLEYDFYKPLAIWAYEEIRGSQWQYKKLVDIASRIKDGPGGWGVSTKDYVDSGIPVIRAINLINGECDLSDCIFISDKKHQELASHKVNSNSVLLSVRGTIGRAAVFYADEYQEANLNAAVVTIDCKNDVLPEFLAEFLNTEVGRIQSQRMANGAVQQNMNLEETGNNLIVIPPKIFQEKITKSRQHRLLIKELSEKLTTAAKYLVEVLIEGKLTETELKNAQTALQKGDIEPDKAILAKLTRKGYEIADEPPLFPDLDALYQAIREINPTSEL